LLFAGNSADDIVNFFADELDVDIPENPSGMPLPTNVVEVGSLWEICEAIEQELVEAEDNEERLAFLEGLRDALLDETTSPQGDELVNSIIDCLIDMLLIEEVEPDAIQGQASSNFGTKQSNIDNDIKDSKMMQMNTNQKINNLEKKQQLASQNNDRNDVKIIQLDSDIKPVNIKQFQQQVEQKKQQQTNQIEKSDKEQITEQAKTIKEQSETKIPSILPFSGGKLFQLGK
jgi:hypothetical protein